MVSLYKSNHPLLFICCSSWFNQTLKQFRKNTTESVFGKLGTLLGSRIPGTIQLACFLDFGKLGFEGIDKDFGALLE